MLFTITNIEDGSKLVRIIKNSKGRTFHWTKVANGTKFDADTARKLAYECSFAGFKVEEINADEEVKRESLAQKEIREKLESLKGQLEATNQALEGRLENWERREFEALAMDYKARISNLEDHIKFCNENNIW